MIEVVGGMVGWIIWEEVFFNFILVLSWLSLRILYYFGLKGGVGYIV